jgi:hypothetical protein
MLRLTSLSYNVTAESALTLALFRVNVLLFILINSNALQKINPPQLFYAFEA